MEQNEFPVARRRLCERVDANWASGIPPSWDAPRIKSLLNERNEREHPDQPLLAATQKQGVILKERYENRTVLPTDTDELSQFKLVEKGDFVISLRSFQGGIERAHDKGIISPAYTILRSSKPETVEYLTRLFKSRPFIEILTTCVTGIRQGQNIDYTRLGTQRIPLPPPNEQTVIVRYLDDADQRVRAYVSAKERLIALLEEERQAVIHQAVTRGLDPNAKLKHSGVEWLGDVPEHWDVSRVKNEFYSLNHRRIPLSATERGTMSVRQYDYYGASGVIDKVEGYLFNDELLLIAEDGANLVLRNLPLAIIARGKFWVNNHAHILKPRGGNLEFLAGLLEGINYTPWISGAAQPKLTQDRLMSIAIAVPPKEQQDQIMERTSTETASIRTSISLARRQIELMEEYRTRLIADVVTGKLEVRGA